ncbi:MAG: imidazolonepropionase [Deltaproteobacteria bacterium]|nr:MAG: imidazolonepropionase [Deltaproteobacteria bacterium]
MKIIEHAKELLTLAPPEGDRENPLGIVRDGAVVLDDARIAWVGPSRDVPPQMREEAEEIIDASGHVVMPGLIDPHTHLVFAGSRQEEFVERIRGTSYLEIARRGGGIRATVRATRAADAETLFALGWARLQDALEWGVTTCEVKSGYGLDLVTEIRLLEVIRALDEKHPIDLVATYLGAHELPDEYRSNRDAYIRFVVEEVIPQVAERKLAEFCDVFCEAGVFDVEESKRVLTAAKRAGLGLRIHADEFHPLGGVEMAARLGAVSADHLLCTSASGIAAMKEAGTVAVLLPGTSFFLGKAYAPARRFLEAGIPVAIGSDFNPGSCMTNNLFFVMTIAATQMRMTPEEIIPAVTRNAARALHRTDIGVLSPGKRADLILLDIPDHICMIYHFGKNHVRSVIKDGRIVSGRH